MNSKNSKKSDPRRLLINLTEKVNLKRSDKYITLSSLSIYYPLKNIKMPYKNKFKLSAPAWNKGFELSDESYSVSDIQDCFEYILKTRKSHTCEKVGHTSEFLFNIYWWTLETTIY